MIKNIVSSTAARLAAAALCVAAAGSLSAASAVKNLTAEANSQNHLEWGYGYQHTNGSVPAFIFTESDANGGRFIGNSGTYPTYLSVHFTDDYEPEKQIVAQRLYIAVSTAQSSYDQRAPQWVVLQGSNSSDVFASGAASTVQDTTAIAGKDDGWTDIAEFGDDETDMTWTTNGKLYEFSIELDNDSSYRYYRLKVKRTGNNQFPVFTQFRLYGMALSSEPVGLSVRCEPDAESVDVTVAVDSFDETNPSTTGSVYLDYGTDSEFEEGSFTRLVLATDVSRPQGNWTDTVTLENLGVGTSYFGRLVVVNGIGRTSELKFEFATIIPLHVSETGDDSTGDGSESSPYRSISQALSVASGIPLVKIAGGTYSASSGETFPLVLPSGAILRGAGSDLTTIDGGNGSTCIVTNAARGEMCSVSGIHFANSGLQPPIVSEATDIAVERCSFTQSLALSGNLETAGAMLLTGAQTALVDGCEFSLGERVRHWVVQTAGTGGVDDICDLTVRNCTFSGNTVAYGLVGCGVQTIHNRYTIQNCIFSGNTVTSYNKVGGRSNAPGACVAMVSLLVREGNNSYPYGELTVDRCQFVSNEANSIIVATFTTDWSNINIQNSLFKDNERYYSGPIAYFEGVIRTYYGRPTVANCTFIGNCGRYCELTDGTFRNCIFSGEESLVANVQYKMNLYGAIVHDTDYGNSTQIVTAPGMGEVLETDPCFADEFGRLRAYSPAVDAGVGVFGQSDLDGNVRVVNSTGAESALCDFGCYESQYGAEPVPTFRMPSLGRVTQPADHAETVMVTLANAESVDFPVEATVTYPEESGFVGPAILTFNSSTAELAYTTPPTLGAYDIVVSAAGVADGVLRVDVVDESVTLFGDRIKVLRSADGALEIPVSLSATGALASEDIAVELVSVEGDGTTTVAWSADGARKISAGSHETGARLVFTPGVGHNCVTLRVGTEFAETGSDVLVLEVLVDPEAFFVSAASGSDATGIGTDSSPFKSVTKAMSYASAGDTVRIAPGTYSAAATDEAFPFTKGGVAFIGEPEGGQSVTLDGANSVDNLFRLDGNESALSVRNMTLANTHEAIAYLQDGYIAMTNCAIVQTQNNNDAPAIAYLFRASKIEMADSTYETDLENLSRQSAFSLMTTQEDITEQSRQSDRWIKVVRCRFRNLRFERALATSLRDNGVPYLAMFSECDFSALRLWIGRPTGIPGGSGNVYMYSIFHLPAGTSVGNDLFKLTVDRSRFVSCKADATASVSHCLPPEITNCIFVDMTNGVSLVHGNHIVGNAAASVRNCTFIRTTGSVVAYGESINPISAEARNCIFVDSEIATHANSRPLTISDSIIYNSARGDYWDGTVTTDDNVLVDVDPKLRKIDVVGTDPLFNASFGASSPAFDAGNDSYAAGDFDLLGNPRVAGKHVDLGALECQGRPAFILIVR